MLYGAELIKPVEQISGEIQMGTMLRLLVWHHVHFRVNQIVYTDLERNGTQRWDPSFLFALKCTSF